jgi:dipeptide/tripeptide permease
VPWGLLIGVKQHLLLALVFAPWLHPNDSPASSRRAIGTALAVVGVITVPFVFWDPAGFWKSVAALQFNERFRLDSLSVMAAVGQQGWTPSGILLVAIPVAALAIGVVLSRRFAPRTPSGFALALGLSLLLLFLFSKKAFCNYYFLVIAALAASIATSDQAAAEGECDTGSSTVRYSRS